MQTITSVGTHEQQRLILLKVLTDPSFRDLSSSIGINMKDIQAGRQVMQCSRKLIARSKNGKRRTSVAKRTVVQALCVGLLPTPTKILNTDDEVSPPTERELSMQEISRQLGFTWATGRRALSSAKMKRADIAEGNEQGWIMLSEDEQRSKYTPELLTALEYWIENNEMVRHSPFKNSLIIKSDRSGRIVKDMTTGAPLRVQKMIMMCNPRELHNHMIQNFDDATEGNQVIISESKIRELLKTSCCHVKKMSTREKLMCGCETCIIFDDMHECLCLFRKRYISRLKREINQMRDGRRKFDLSSKLETYMNQVCSDPSNDNHDPLYIKY
jgi:hypothetical protein